MRGYTIAKRLEALEQRAAVKPLVSELQKRYRAVSAFLRDDPVFASALATLGRANRNERFTERIDTPEKRAAAKDLAGRLSEARQLLRPEG